MDYVLQPELLSPPPAQSITEDYFNQLKEARVVLIAAFDIEESFDLLVSNYIEMEGSGMNLALSAAVRSKHDYADMFEVRAELSRRIVNLLSSARMYIDSLPSNAPRCGILKSDIESWLNKEYGSDFAYRFMEALRNQAQHRGFTVHHLGTDSPWLPPGERQYLETTLRVLALRRFLAEIGGFKASTLAECPEKIDILASARRYLESLSKVQQQVRGAAAAKVTEARELTKGAIEGYVAFAEGASHVGLAAIATHDGKEVESVPVFLEWDDVRLKLQNRNTRMANLSVHKVSNWSGSSKEAKSPKS
jgi:hypothetical protein